MALAEEDVTMVVNVHIYFQFFLRQSNTVKSLQVLWLNVVSQKVFVREKIFDTLRHLLIQTISSAYKLAVFTYPIVTVQTLNSNKNKLNGNTSLKCWLCCIVLEHKVSVVGRHILTRINRYIISEKQMTLWFQVKYTEHNVENSPSGWI